MSFAPSNTPPRPRRAAPSSDRSRSTSRLRESGHALADFHSVLAAQQAGVLKVLPAAHREEDTSRTSFSSASYLAKTAADPSGLRERKVKSSAVPLPPRDTLYGAYQGRPPRERTPPRNQLATYDARSPYAQPQSPTRAAKHYMQDKENRHKNRNSGSSSSSVRSSTSKGKEKEKEKEKDNASVTSSASGASSVGRNTSKAKTPRAESPLVRLERELCTAKNMHLQEQQKYAAEQHAQDTRFHEAFSALKARPITRESTPASSADRPGAGATRRSTGSSTDSGTGSGSGRHRISPPGEGADLGRSSLLGDFSDIAVDGAAAAGAGGVGGDMLLSAVPAPQLQPEKSNRANLPQPGAVGEAIAALSRALVQAEAEAEAEEELLEETPPGKGDEGAGPQQEPELQETELDSAACAEGVASGSGEEEEEGGAGALQALLAGQWRGILRETMEADSDLQAHLPPMHVPERRGAGAPLSGAAPAAATAAASPSTAVLGDAQRVAVSPAPAPLSDAIQGSADSKKRKEPMLVEKTVRDRDREKRPAEAQAPANAAAVTTPELGSTLPSLPVSTPATAAITGSSSGSSSGSGSGSGSSSSGSGKKKRSHGDSRGAALSFSNALAAADALHIPVRQAIHTPASAAAAAAAVLPSAPHGGLTPAAAVAAAIPLRKSLRHSSPTETLSASASTPTPAPAPASASASASAEVSEHKHTHASVAAAVPVSMDVIKAKVIKVATRAAAEVAQAAANETSAALVRCQEVCEASAVDIAYATARECTENIAASATQAAVTAARQAAKDSSVAVMELAVNTAREAAIEAARESAEEVLSTVRTETSELISTRRAETNADIQDMAMKLRDMSRRFDGFVDEVFQQLTHVRNQQQLGASAVSAVATEVRFVKQEQFLTATAVAEVKAAVEAVLKNRRPASPGAPSAPSSSEKEHIKREIDTRFAALEAMEALVLEAEAELEAEDDEEVVSAVSKVVLQAPVVPYEDAHAPDVDLDTDTEALAELSFMTVAADTDMDTDIECAAQSLSSVGSQSWQLEESVILEAGAGAGAGADAAAAELAVVGDEVAAPPSPSASRRNTRVFFVALFACIAALLMSNAHTRGVIVYAVSILYSLLCKLRMLAVTAASHALTSAKSSSVLLVRRLHSRGADVCESLLRTRLGRFVLHRVQDLELDLDPEL